MASPVALALRARTARAAAAGLRHVSVHVRSVRRWRGPVAPARGGTSSDDSARWSCSLGGPPLRRHGWARWRFIASPRSSNAGRWQTKRPDPSATDRLRRPHPSHRGASKSRVVYQVRDGSHGGLHRDVDSGLVPLLQPCNRATAPSGDPSGDRHFSGNGSPRAVGAPTAMLFSKVWR